MSSPTPPASHEAPGHEETAPAPQPQPRSRMRGNWRSLVLSMAAVAAVVLVLFSIVPRPANVTQPPIDVTPVAKQAHRDDKVTVWVPQLGEPGKPWKATSVRYAPSPQGPTEWYAGYHRTDDDSVFVAVRQIPAAAPPQARQAWVTEAVSRGQEQGRVDVGGASWTSYSTGGDPARRSLVGELGGMTTVVSGLADQQTLVAVTESLRPYGG